MFYIHSLYILWEFHFLSLMEFKSDGIQEWALHLCGRLPCLELLLWVNRVWIGDGWTHLSLSLYASGGRAFKGISSRPYNELELPPRGSFTHKKKTRVSFSCSSHSYDFPSLEYCYFNNWNERIVPKEKKLHCFLMASVIHMNFHPLNISHLITELKETRQNGCLWGVGAYQNCAWTFL